MKRVGLLREVDDGVRRAASVQSIHGGRGRRREAALGNLHVIIYEPLLPSLAGTNPATRDVVAIAELRQLAKMVRETIMVRRRQNDDAWLHRSCSS